jgi:NAD-dependent DNA ligase
LKEAGLENKLDIQESPNSDVSINKSSPLFGKTIVLTGTRDKTVLEILKKVGATQGSNVSKNTFLVVAKSADDDTGKAEEARKLGITILSVDQFTKLYLI